jgi:hypothetical protein
MIIREFYRTRSDGVNLYKTYSDKNVYIQKEGIDFHYTQAVDIEDASFVYVETDVEIKETQISAFRNSAKKER